MPEKKRVKGFTLIELLMAMAMTAIMIGVVLVSLSGAKTNRDVDGEAAKILSALREVQNYSLTGRGLGGVRACGQFRVSLSGTTFSTYYSYKTSGTCEAVESPMTYVVGNGVTLSFARDSGIAFGVDDFLNFTIPNGVVKLDATELSGSQWVRFQLTKSGVSENVCVYPFGRIEQKPIGMAC